MIRQPWEDFARIGSQSFVPDQITQARGITPGELCDMAVYRQPAPLRVLLAYAQEELIYDNAGNVIAATPEIYAAVARAERVNVFGLSYRRDATLYLHKTLADIVIGAAIHLYQTQGWTTILYDGMRTMEGAYRLYRFATDEDLSNGLLALPGQSAHNKAMAVDSMMIDAQGREIDMGGHFDHLDMVTNNRAYNGHKISEAAKKNRLIREAAFLRSAFAQGLLIAPLKPEFWDDRLPENRADLWRVLDSTARCLGITLLSAEDETLRRENRKAFEEKWERWSYADFLARWDEIFRGHTIKLKEILGVTTPPPMEKPEFYHGNYQPIYDMELRASGKHITEGRADA